MARIKAQGVELTLTGIEDLIRKSEADRLYRRMLRKAMRQAGQVMKSEYVPLARARSRRMARRVRVKLKQGPGPAYLPVEVKVRSTYGGAPTIVSGRKVGRKMPPLAALGGSYGAALLVSRRGLPGHPFVPQVIAASAPRVERLLSEVGKSMEQAWKG